MIQSTDIRIGDTATFLVDGDGEELTGTVITLFKTPEININGWVDTLALEDLPAALVDVKDTGVWVVPFAWMTNTDRQAVNYSLTVDFSSDRPLTPEEIGEILLAVEAQISEPVTYHHDDETLIGPIDMDVTVKIKDASIKKWDLMSASLNEDDQIHRVGGFSAMSMLYAIQAGMA